LKLPSQGEKWWGMSFWISRERCLVCRKKANLKL